MKTIYDLVTPKDYVAYWTQSNADRQPYMLGAFFNQRKQLGIEIASLRGKRPKVRLLDTSAFDAKVIPLGREGVVKSVTEMPFFKNSKNVDEKQRQELNLVLQSGNEAVINSVKNEIFDDNTSLLDFAMATKEAMMASMLTTGTISLGTNGQGYLYEYDIPESNKLSKSWEDSTTADPIQDISDWQDMVENETGIRPTNLLMNGTTFKLLQNANKIKTAIYAFATGVVTPNREQVRAYVESATGCTIHIYNKGYHKDGETTLTKFVGDGVVVLFPEGAIGEFVYGTTPEESDLMSGATDAEVAIVDDGVAVTTTKLTDPVNVDTKVSMIGLPKLYLPETIVIADVDGE